MGGKQKVNRKEKETLKPDCSKCLHHLEALDFCRGYRMPCHTLTVENCKRCKLK